MTVKFFPAGRQGRWEQSDGYWETTGKLTLITDSGGLDFDLHAKVVQTPE